MLAIDRGGLVGADGATHNGAFDLSYLACVPNMLVMAPADENECRQMLTTAYHHDGPSAVRYPRGHGPGAQMGKGLIALPIGKGEIRRTGSHVALLAFGSLLAPALEAGDMLNATVANMRFVKPLDHDLIRELAFSHDLLVTLEENTVIGGAGAEVARSLAEQGLNARLLRLGLPDRFTEHGDSATLLAQLGLDAKGIAEKVEQAILE